MSPAPTTLDPAAQRALLIARTERRRARMELLADVGMALAKEIAVRFIDGPYHPEPRLDPGGSYATVARSIRLTTTLEAKTDERILALCEGKAPVAAWAAPSTEQAATPWFSERVQHRPRPADSSLNDPDRRLNGKETEWERLIDIERPDVTDGRRCGQVRDEADPRPHAEPAFKRPAVADDGIPPLHPLGQDAPAAPPNGSGADPPDRE